MALKGLNNCTDIMSIIGYQSMVYLHCPVCSNGAHLQPIHGYKTGLLFLHCAGSSMSADVQCGGSREVLWTQSVGSGWEPCNWHYWLGMCSESLCFEEKPTGSVFGPNSESDFGSRCDSDGVSGLGFAGLGVSVVFLSSPLAAVDGSSCEHFYFLSCRTS